MLIHKIIPSFTQEDVIFKIRPAVYISLLIAETMPDNEAIFMLGCKRYCNYKGYRKSFRFIGPNEDIHKNKMISGIAIDAVVNKGKSQFQRDNIERDLNKAFLGFGGIDNEIEEISKKVKICQKVKIYLI